MPQTTIHMQALAHLIARAYDEAHSQQQREGVALVIREIERATDFPMTDVAAEEHAELLANRM